MEQEHKRRVRYKGTHPRNYREKYKDIIEIDAFNELKKLGAERVFQILPENQARIVTPLITGEQRLVSPELYQIYRRSGIVHVLSVSGFHMALLAGFLFLLIRIQVEPLVHWVLLIIKKMKTY